MNAYTETRDILKKYNISANKKLGQNFLIDDEVIDGIINASNVNKNDLVIEIGPGLGTLTKRLLENSGKVICIELDKKMIKTLLRLIKPNGFLVAYKAKTESITEEMDAIKSFVPEYKTKPLTVPFLQNHERHLVIIPKN